MITYKLTWKQFAVLLNSEKENAQLNQTLQKFRSETQERDAAIHARFPAPRRAVALYDFIAPASHEEGATRSEVVKVRRRPRPQRGTPPRPGTWDRLHGAA